MSSLYLAFQQVRRLKLHFQSYAVAINRLNGAGKLDYSEIELMSHDVLGSLLSEVETLVHVIV